MADGWKSVVPVVLGPLILVVGGVLVAIQLRGESTARGPSSFLVSRPPEEMPVPAQSTRLLLTPPIRPSPASTATVPTGTLQPEQIRAAMATIEQPISACGADGGRVMLEFQFGPEGLREVAVVDAGQLSQELRDCLAAAAWGVEWPRTENVVTVRYPFSVAGG